MFRQVWSSEAVHRGAVGAAAAVDGDGGDDEAGHGAGGGGCWDADLGGLAAGAVVLDAPAEVAGVLAQLARRG